MLTPQQQHEVIRFLKTIDDRSEDDAFMAEVIYIPACSTPDMARYPEYIGAREGCMDYYRVFLRGAPMNMVNEAFYHILKELLKVKPEPKEIGPAEFTEAKNAARKEMWRLDKKVTEADKELTAGEFNEFISGIAMMVEYYSQQAEYWKQRRKQVYDEMNYDADNAAKQAADEQYYADHYPGY